MEKKQMNAKDWFSVGVKIVAFVFFMRGIEDILWFLLEQLGYFEQSVNETMNYRALSIVGLVFVILSLFLMRYSDSVTGFAFPVSGEDAEEPENEL
jgi:hypothetical protein